MIYLIILTIIFLITVWLGIEVITASWKRGERSYAIWIAFLMLLVIGSESRVIIEKVVG